MTTHEQNALLHILGSVDGHLEPRPLDAEQLFQADRQAEHRYTGIGAITIPNPGDDPAGRKRYDRAVSGLESAGLIFRHGRLIGLTVDGHDQARHLAGLPTVTDALDLLAAIHECPVRWSDGWVGEPSLCGLSPIPDAPVGSTRIPDAMLHYLTPHIDALIVARLIQWRDVAGHDVLLYAATESGLKRAAQGDAKRWFTRMKKPCRFELPEAYSSAWQTAHYARPHAALIWPNRIYHRDLVDSPSTRCKS